MMDYLPIAHDADDQMRLLIRTRGRMNHMLIKYMILNAWAYQQLDYEDDGLHTNSPWCWRLDELINNKNSIAQDSD